MHAYLATISEYHTFSPTLLNEFRLGFNRYSQRVPASGNQSFPGLDQFPNINVYELNAAYGPDSSAPQYTIQNLYQATDSLTRRNEARPIISAPGLEFDFALQLYSAGARRL